MEGGRVVVGQVAFREGLPLITLLLSLLLATSCGVSTAAVCPTGTPCKLMPVGDSTTRGFGSTDEGGYRSALYHLILAGGKSATFVGSQTNGPATVDGQAFPAGHEGHDAHLIKDVAPYSGVQQYMPRAIGTYTPHAVLLMIGLNDFGFGVDVSNAPTRLASLLDTITVPIFLANIPPSRLSVVNNQIDTYNAAMAALVTTANATGRPRIYIVNVHDAVTANPTFITDYFTDDLHFNDAGYAVIAAAWYAAISSHLHAP